MPAAGALPTYEIYALRYAEVMRRAHENFIFPDPHDGDMPLDYFLWAIQGNGRTIVVDTGFTEEAARRRGRTYLRSPAAALESIGIRAGEVAEVIITHLHYDHVGALDLFSGAIFHVQDSEVAYATGRHMHHAALNHPFDVEDVVGLIRRVYQNRVMFHDGDADIAPGISVHRIGGHSDGLQAVRVHTERGFVVLACAAHYYANFLRQSPFPIVFKVGAMLEGYRRLRELADSDDHIIPGHDPEVRTTWESAQCSRRRSARAWSTDQRSRPVRCNHPAPDALNDRGIRSARGGSRHVSSVQNLIARAERLTAPV